MKVLASFLICVSTLCAQGVDEVLTEGDALDEKNRNSEALSVYLKADAQEPNDARVLRRVSKQYSQLMLDAKSAGEKRQLGEKALDAAQRAVTANPNDSQAHLALAVAYGRIALDQPARRKVETSRLVRQEAETAARLDPKNDYAWHVLGRWNYELANFNPILKALARAIYGNLPDASNEKAVECFNKAIALQPRRASHHLELGRAYLALGDKQKARDEFNEGLSLPSAEKDDENNKQRARAALNQLQ